MSKQNVLEAAATIGISAAALVGWWHYYPTSPLISRLGLVGGRANTQRHCGRMLRIYHLGPVTAWIPTGNVICEARRSFGNFWKSEEVEVNPFSRRVKHARRTLVPVDSLSWTATGDSIRSSMASAGGKSLPCYPPYGKEPPYIVSEEAWRFEGYAVRLVTYHWFPPWANANGPPTWFLQLDGYPNDPPGCGSNRTYAMNR